MLAQECCPPVWTAGRCRSMTDFSLDFSIDGKLFLCMAVNFRVSFWYANRDLPDPWCNFHRDWGRRLDGGFVSSTAQRRLSSFHDRLGSCANGCLPMWLSFLSGTTKSSVSRTATSSLASVRARCFQALTFGLVVFLTFLVICLAGCAKNQEKKTSTATSGSAAIFASPAIEPVVQAGADQFSRLYQNANVNVYSLNSRAIVDSMIYRRTDVGYFDRSLSEAESLAVVNTRKHLYSFVLGSTVATWIVNPKNPANIIDSLQALNILTGRVTSWKALGGSGDKVNIYLPPLGDGAWSALESFFASALTEVDAHYWPSDSLVVERVAEDPNALGFVGKPVYDSRVKKLRWRNPILADPVVANIGSLQEGKYPFRIRLYYYTIADRTDLASGFLSFMASNAGQRLIADQGFLPEMVPARVVTLPPSEDHK